MNFIKTNHLTVKSIGLLNVKSSSLINSTCNYAILKKPRKIKGIIEPQPHQKIQLIDGINQPEYLKYLKPTVPFYNVQNIQIKGYDYVTLDEFKKFIIRLLRKIDIKIKTDWTTPSQELSLDKFQNESYGVEESIKIHLFERNIQIDELPSYKAQILIETLMLSKPPGVTITIERHDPSVLKKLYMIDVELEKAKEELKDWSRPYDEISKTKRIF